MSAQRSPELAAEFAPASCTTYPWRSTRPGNVGGPADLFFTPRDAADLAAFMRQLPPDMPLLWIGSAATSWCATAESAAPSSRRTARWAPSNA